MKHTVLNESKNVVNLPEIKFHRHLMTKDGILSFEDASRVKSILEMPIPTDAPGVRRLCALVQYMTKFLSDLSAVLEPIHALTRKGAEFIWTTVRRGFHKSVC